MRLRIPHVVAALALAGCAVEPLPPLPRADAPEVSTGQEFTLTLGAGAPIAGGEFQIFFKEVFEDSRCPRDVTCVWEGNARLHFMLREISPMGQGVVEVQESGFELNTSERFARRYEFSKYVVELRRLEPPPAAGAPTSGYIVTLLVSLRP
jgi:hypothetical protein